MSSLNGQLISDITKSIYHSDPSFFRNVFNYNDKNGQVTFKQILSKKAVIGQTNGHLVEASATMDGFQNGYVDHSLEIENVGSNANVRETVGSGAVSNNSRGDDSDMEAIFQEAAKKYNVDVRLLKAMGKVESGFNPKAVSSAGAKGVMQLMPANCKEAGITDPFDPRQNIMGGAKEISGYLKKYHGNLDLALAAYNAGIGNVAKYGGVPPFKETQNYIKKVRHYMNVDLVIGDSHKHVSKKDKDKASERLDKITYDKNVANMRMKI